MTQNSITLYQLYQKFQQESIKYKHTNITDYIPKLKQLAIDSIKQNDYALAIEIITQLNKNKK